jgi:hypothetical protein
MATLKLRPLVIAAAVALGGSGLAAAAAAPVSAGVRSGGGDCIAHLPSVFGEYQAKYTGSCSGHDEPELDPVSSLAGSARDLTWTVVLPTDGAVPVSSVGPTFWWGGTVTDPNKDALFGQAFLEVQFYPDSIVSNCEPDGGFSVTNAPNKFSVCTPTWQLSPQFHESAAFNAELFRASTSQPLVMNAGDTVKIHFYVGAPGPGWNINVTDVTTGQSGTVTLNSKYGPMLPAFSKQQIGNALGWGLVDDTPNSFVWEIGHTSPFTHPAAQFCVPGQTFCDSFDQAHWLGFKPLQIKSVTFADGSTAKEWAAVSDTGGKAEVLGKSFVGPTDCSSYGGPFCIYPWFTFNGTDNAFSYGANYPGTQFQYGQADQFQQTLNCGGPFGPNSTYCDTVLKPTP